jgi:LysM repeat protein
MNTRRNLIITLVLAVSIILAGCKMPASAAPKATATVATGDGPLPGTQTMDLFNTFATATAAKFTQDAQSVVSTPVPDVVLPTATPVPPVAVVTAAQPVVPAPTQGVVTLPTLTVPATYTVQKGEWIYCLARRFNVNPQELISLNGITNPDKLADGKVLKIPQTGHTYPGTRAWHAHPTTYTVKAGDTIYTIACYYGDVYPESIAAANGLTAPYKLTTGATLQIP